MEQARKIAIAEEELMELEEMDALLQSENTEMTEEDADRLIRIYKAIQSDYARFEALATRQKQEIERRFRLKADKYENELSSIALTLQAYAEKQPVKETKTQKKYQLLSGDIIIKKPSADLVAEDKQLLLESIRNTRYEYCKQTKVELMWAQLKKALDFTSDGTIVDKETGEVVDLPGLSVQEKPGSVVIK